MSVREPGHASSCAVFFTIPSTASACTCSVGEVERLRARAEKAEALLERARAPSIMARASDLLCVEGLSALIPPRPGFFSEPGDPSAFNMKTVPFGEWTCEALRRVLAEREIREVLRADAEVEIAALKTALTAARLIVDEVASIYPSDLAPETLNAAVSARKQIDALLGTPPNTDRNPDVADIARED